MQGSAIKLYKHVLYTPSSMPTDPLIFFAADLLAQVEAHAVHRFLITPYDQSDPDQPGLLLWFMAVDMYVTSSSAAGIQRAIKVLVRNSTLADLEGQGQTQQEVEPVGAPLPGLFEHLEQTLDRHFQEAGRQVTGAWRASYLPRFASETIEDERAASFES